MMYRVAKKSQTDANQFLIKLSKLVHNLYFGSQVIDGITSVGCRYRENMIVTKNQIFGEIGVCSTKRSTKE